MQPGYCISQPEIRVYSAETIKILQTARIAEEIEPTALPDWACPWSSGDARRARFALTSTLPRQADPQKT